MKRFKMLLLAILSVTMVMAQEMKVAGTLVDRDTKEGVLMATVQLLKSDSTFVKGVLTDDIVVSYRYDNESVRSDGPAQAGFTNVPEIELKINSLPIEAKARTLRAYWAFDAQYELQKEYGQDIETLLATQATGELAHEIDNELTLDLLKFADAGTPLTWSRSIII